MSLSKHPYSGGCDELEATRSQTSARDIEFLRMAENPLPPTAISDRVLGRAPQGEDWLAETPEEAWNRARRLIGLGALRSRGASEVQVTPLGESLVRCDDASWGTSRSQVSVPSEATLRPAGRLDPNEVGGRAPRKGVLSRIEESVLYRIANSRIGFWFVTVVVVAGGAALWETMTGGRVQAEELDIELRARIERVAYEVRRLDETDDGIDERFVQAMQRISNREPMRMTELGSQSLIELYRQRLSLSRGPLRDSLISAREAIERIEVLSSKPPSAFTLEDLRGGTSELRGYLCGVLAIGRWQGDEAQQLNC